MALSVAFGHVLKKVVLGELGVYQLEICISREGNRRCEETVHPSLYQEIKCMVHGRIYCSNKLTPAFQSTAGDLIASPTQSIWVPCNKAIYVFNRLRWSNTFMHLEGECRPLTFQDTIFIVAIGKGSYVLVRKICYL